MNGNDLTPHRVRVPGREDIGEVVQAGKNVGSNPAIYCYVIYFPETGECCFYEGRRVTRID